MGKRSRNDAPPSHLVFAASDSATPLKSTSSTRGSKLKFKDTASQATKRTKFASSSLPSSIDRIVSLEGSLSEEILLRCLSFLSAHDLVTVARVSSGWHRLAHDPQLWRSLYLETYASSATRRHAIYGGVTRSSRPWRDLYKISTNWRNGAVKSSTILTDTVRKSVLARVPQDLSVQGESTSIVHSDPAGASVDEDPGPPPWRDDQDARDDTLLLQFHRQYFFTASKRPSSSRGDPPSITVSQTVSTGTSVSLATFYSTRLESFYAERPPFSHALAITEMRLDASRQVGPILAVFYTTGQFSIFRLNLPTTTSPFSANEVYTSLSISSSFPSIPSTSSDPVSLARLHYPLLVTCSESFTIRFYRLSSQRSRFDEGVDEQSGVTETLDVQEAETPLQTRERWAPVVLTLEPCHAHKARRRTARGPRSELWSAEPAGNAEGTKEAFRVCLAYSQPVFPNDWTVGLQEFTVELEPCDPTHAASSAISISTLSASSPPLHTRLSLTPRRTTSPLSELGPGAARSTTASRPETPVTAIEFKWPWIVTSKTDNTLQVYRVAYEARARRSSSSSSSSSSHGSFERRRTRTSRDEPDAAAHDLVIRHEKTLFGHTARVGSVALISSLDEEGFDGDGRTRSGSKGRKRERVGPTRTRCVSAGDDGKVKVWDLVDDRFEGDRGRGREGRTGMVDIVEEGGEHGQVDGDEEDGRTEWQKMKRRRDDGVRRASRPSATSTTRDAPYVEERRPERVRQVFVDEDKIVVVGRRHVDGEAASGGETVRVLRFD
ncbi:hypothetical protein JCM10212_003298 [Sporobolomyces blumeae]